MARAALRAARDHRGQGAPDQVHLLAKGSAELVRREQEKETILVALTPGEFIVDPWRM